MSSASRTASSSSSDNLTSLVGQSATKGGRVVEPELDEKESLSVSEAQQQQQQQQQLQLEKMKLLPPIMAISAPRMVTKPSSKTTSVNVMSKKAISATTTSSNSNISTSTSTSTGDSTGDSTPLVEGDSPAKSIVNKECRGVSEGSDDWGDFQFHETNESPEIDASSITTDLPVVDDENTTTHDKTTSSSIAAVTERIKSKDQIQPNVDIMAGDEESDSDSLPSTVTNPMLLLALQGAGTEEEEEEGGEEEEEGVHGDDSMQD
jgi:hypothetical protein